MNFRTMKGKWVVIMNKCEVCKTILLKYIYMALEEQFFLLKTWQKKSGQYLTLVYSRQRSTFGKPYLKHERHIS